MTTSNQLATDNADLLAWLEGISSKYGLKLDTIEKASADAGFREYFRIEGKDGRTFVVMNATRDSAESFSAFRKIDALMRDEANLNAPEIFEADEARRFMLLSDLGRKTYLDVLNEENATELMDRATTALIEWQKISRPHVLPAYDRDVLLREINLFPEWYVSRHRGVTWTEEERKWWDMSVNAILERNCREALVFVHRDFMPRNLMVANGLPGILDFQDALYGPVSYDIASLLRDAFISWGEPFVLDTTIRYWEKARKANIPVPSDFSVFYQDLEFMGVQRHLKILGIFARLHYRDGKSRYLEDTPRFIEYVRKTSQRYIQLSPLKHLIDNLEGSNTKFGYTF